MMFHPPASTTEDASLVGSLNDGKGLGIALEDGRISQMCTQGQSRDVSGVAQSGPPHDPYAVRIPMPQPPLWCPAPIRPATINPFPHQPVTNSWYGGSYISTQQPYLPQHQPRFHQQPPYEIHPFSSHGPWNHCQFPIPPSYPLPPPPVPTEGDPSNTNSLCDCSATSSRSHPTGSKRSPPTLKLTRLGNVRRWGRAKMFSTDRGFGFVEDLGPVVHEASKEDKELRAPIEKDVFLHWMNIQVSPEVDPLTFRSIDSVNGEIVEYDLWESKGKGLSALNATGLYGQLVRGHPGAPMRRFEASRYPNPTSIKPNHLSNQPPIAIPTTCTKTERSSPLPLSAPFTTSNADTSKLYSIEGGGPSDESTTTTLFSEAGTYQTSLDAEEMNEGSVQSISVESIAELKLYTPIDFTDWLQTRRQVEAKSDSSWSDSLGKEERTDEGEHLSAEDMVMPTRGNKSMCLPSPILRPRTAPPQFPDWDINDSLSKLSDHLPPIASPAAQYPSPSSSFPDERIEISSSPPSSSLPLPQEGEVQSSSQPFSPPGPSDEDLPPPPTFYPSYYHPHHHLPSFIPPPPSLLPPTITREFPYLPSPPPPPSGVLPPTAPWPYHYPPHHLPPPPAFGYLPSFYPPEMPLPPSPPHQQHM